MKKVSLGVLAAGIIAMGTVSCSKDDSVATGKEKAKAIYSEIDDHDSSMILEMSQMEIKSDVNDIPSSGVSVFNSEMLQFETIDDLTNVLESMTNKQYGIIDEWISDFSGFSSLRAYYEEIKDDQGIDDFELSADRIADIAFEAILNEDRAVRIADTVARYDMDFTQVSVYLVDSEENESPEPFDTRNIRSGCGGNGTSWHFEWEMVQPPWCSNCRIVGTKWVHNLYYWWSLGFGATHQKKNSSGNWKDEVVDNSGTIMALKDQYYSVSWYILNSPYSNTISSELFTGNINAKGTSLYIDYAAPFGYVYCVTEFGRTHNWGCNEFPANPESHFNTTVWNPTYWHNDAHVDNWDY